MNEEKKNKKGGSVLKTILVVILLALFAVGGWFGNDFYRKAIKNENTSESDEIEKEKSDQDDLKDGSLDVNSDLVKNLYNKVTDSEYNYNGELYRNCKKNWLYGTGDSGYKEEFDVATAAPEEKANFVFRNLEKSKGTKESCDNLNIPDRVDSFYSICAFNTEVNPIGDEISYDVDYVESIYQDLFGKDDKFDTNLILKGQGNLIKFLNIGGKYYEYATIGGSVCGPVKYIDKIYKAEKKNHMIYIYEEEEYFEEDVSKSINKFVYTFRELDGSYYFVSRKKV